jgi:hypothetical protein
MVVFSKFVVIAGTASAQRDLFQAPVNPTFLSQTRPARPAVSYSHSSPDVLMVAPADSGIPVYAVPPSDYDETSQVWGWTAALSAVAIGAVAGRAIGEFYSNEDTAENSSQQYELAALAIAGHEAPPPAVPRSSPNMLATAAVDADDAFCYGLPGNIAPFGDFDPLGLGEGVKSGYDDPKAEMMRWREAELTHGRVSMLAALGFLVQESFHPLFGGAIEGAAINQIPQLPSEYWALLITGIGFAEKHRINVGWCSIASLPHFGPFYVPTWPCGCVEGLRASCDAGRLPDGRRCGDGSAFLAEKRHP